MNASRQLRYDLESTLAKRIPGALSPRNFPVRTKLSCGISDIDSLLDGGLPHGAISELSGAACSGRTTLALRIAAQITSQTQVCAWIDATDAFDPESAKANSIDLDRLLWIRCGVLPSPQPAHLGTSGRTDTQPRSDPSSQPGSGNSLHPRTEANGLDDAVERFLNAKGSPPQSPRPHAPPVRQAKPGTPGAPNFALSLASSATLQPPAQRTVQISTDRLPARRGAQLLELHKAEYRPVALCKERPGASQGNTAKKPAPWNRLDQALRATDLLMQSGGFGAVMLDLGGIAPQAVNRIPLATWFRFRAAADRTRTCFILLTQHPCAQSSAEVSLRVSLDRAAKGTVMTSLPIKVALHRQRFQQISNVTSIRKGPQRASAADWSPPTAWAATR